MASESRIKVSSEHGLHARPAARLVQSAAEFRSRIEIWNASTGRGPASARSILSVIGLGVRQGHEIVIRADGDDEEQALSSLIELLSNGAADG